MRTILSRRSWILAASAATALFLSFWPSRPSHAGVDMNVVPSCTVANGIGTCKGTLRSFHDIADPSGDVIFTTSVAAGGTTRFDFGGSIAGNSSYDCHLTDPEDVALFNQAVAGMSFDDYFIITFNSAAQTCTKLQVFHGSPLA